MVFGFFWKSRRSLWDLLHQPIDFRALRTGFYVPRRFPESIRVRFRMSGSQTLVETPRISPTDYGISRFQEPFGTTQVRPLNRFPKNVPDVWSSFAVWLRYNRNRACIPKALWNETEISLSHSPTYSFLGCVTVVVVYSEWCLPKCLLIFVAHADLTIL